MAELATIARPYARAAFEHAQSAGKLSQWTDALAAAAATVNEPAVDKLLNHPRVTPSQLVELIADVAGGRLDNDSRNFIATLAENGRLGLLPQIAAMYEALRAEAESRAEVAVISAAPLDATQQQRLAGALKKRLQREVHLQCSVDPSLVGGAIVRCGDLVIDGSVKVRLARLADTVTH